MKSCGLRVVRTEKKEKEFLGFYNWQVAVKKDSRRVKRRSDAARSVLTSKDLSDTLPVSS